MSDPVQEQKFPLDSFRDAAIHLRRPFTPEAVKFKVQAIWPKADPTGGLIVAYIDARLVVERLNLIIPHLWFDEYEEHDKFLLCRMTVDGIARQDVGEFQGIKKGLYSDALKRAAVKFGVGVSLYAIPKMMLNVKDGHLKQKKTAKGLTLELTVSGEKYVRSTYQTWLKERGIEAFGEPLNHGDVENAQGDPDVESAAESEAPQETPSGPSTASEAERSQILAAAAENRMPSSLLAKVILIATGHENIVEETASKWESEQDARSYVVRALAKLPAEDVPKVIAAIEAPE